MNKDIDVIIGMGEIGKGLYQVIFNSGELVYGLDLNKQGGLEVVDMNDSGDIGKYSVPLEEIAKRVRLLHICIPGNIDNFVPVVSAYIEVYKPRVTVVHSTVPVGTTERLNQMGVVAHSPVRGKHPNMADGLLNYVKYIGMPEDISVKDWELLLTTFHTYGIKVRTMSSPKATELAKILSTTRYGVNLLFADMQNELIEKYGLNYFDVVTEWEHTYNEGLQQVGLQKYRRPILKPPNGYIGGHCVYENATMLLKQIPRFSSIAIFLKAIKEFGRIGDKDVEKQDTVS